MSPNERRAEVRRPPPPVAAGPLAPPALCVAIHDVAPATWPECLRLLRAVRAVADIPLTWLVVPRYHGSAARSPACETMLGTLLAQGHEVALHGYTHQDSAPLGLDLRSRFVRGVYTRREGEFSAIDMPDACRRIELGLDWLRERKLAPSGEVGFVAPAWLMGRGAWAAIQRYPFAYTTTWSHFYLLRQRSALFAPALVYTARNKTGRLLSPLGIDAGAALLTRAPLLRLALHPRDAHHSALMRHMQKFLARQLGSREPMTKAAFAARFALAGHMIADPARSGIL